MIQLKPDVERVDDFIKATIVVPAFNEEQGLPIVLEKLFNVIDSSYEVIVVDDGSDDCTYEEASRFPCRLVKHDANRGKGEALKTGISFAKGDHVIWIDADDTYPVDIIPEMSKALSNGTDLVYASRMKGREGIPLFNRVGNAIFHSFVSNLYGFTPNDCCTGLCGVKKKYLSVMDLEFDKFTIESEVAIKAGRMKLRMLDLPIRYQSRIGKAKLNGIKDGFQIMMKIIKLIFWRPQNTFRNI